MKEYEKLKNSYIKYKTEEVAKMLNLKVSQVLYRVSKKQLISTSTKGGHKYFVAADIYRYILEYKPRMNQKEVRTSLLDIGETKEPCYIIQSLQRSDLYFIVSNTFEVQFNVVKGKVIQHIKSLTLRKKIEEFGFTLKPLKN